MPVRSATSADCPAITSAYLTSWRAGYRDLLTEADHGSSRTPEGRTGRRRLLCPTEWYSSQRLMTTSSESPNASTNPTQWRLPWLQMLYAIPPVCGTDVVVELLREPVAAGHKAGHRSNWCEVVDRQARARRFYERERFARDRSMPPGSNVFFPLTWPTRRYTFSQVGHVIPVGPGVDVWVPRKGSEVRVLYAHHITVFVHRHTISASKGS